MFEHYKDCLFNGKPLIKSQQRFKSDQHNVYTEEVNKIALSNNDDKRLQTHNKITTYPYGTNAFKVCEREMLSLLLLLSLKNNNNKLQYLHMIKNTRMGTAYNTWVGIFT